jgi:ATP-binding cassette, subfamily C (CFTR/MRP), member 1
MVYTFRALVQITADQETKMVSVERIRQYSLLKQEAPAHTDLELPQGWPLRGQVELRGYTTTYSQDIDPVLRNLTLTLSAGARIGVVGRTGAGKSSLALALFRILEASGGSIAIDGVDIAAVGLDDLRASLCIIPQDPIVFEGTLRDNLDPLGEVGDDAQLWRALQLAGIDDKIRGLEGKLDTRVASGGSNFSAGERQLLTMAAAVLRKRRVVVFDEASSATDAATDAIIQRTIRTEFDGSTMLVIAHRINTIIDSDYILVLDHGQVAEFAPPQELLANPASAFALLVADSQSTSGGEGGAQ